MNLGSVYLDLGVPPSCPTAQAELGGIIKIQVNPTQIRVQMGHPVQVVIVSISNLRSDWTFEASSSRNKCSSSSKSRQTDSTIALTPQVRRAFSLWKLTDCRTDDLPGHLSALCAASLPPRVEAEDLPAEHALSLAVAQAAPLHHLHPLHQPPKEEEVISY